MKIRFTKIKQRKSLTLWGWLVVVICMATITFVWMKTIHNFLAVNKPIDTHILIIEGYVPDFVLIDLAAEAKRNSKILLVCTGLPMSKAIFCDSYKNDAEYNAAALQYFGVDSLQIINAPVSFIEKERTYTTALAAKEKLRENGYTSGKINIICVGTHARRSWYLYRKAFKNDWKVGVLSYQNITYAPESWWHSSEGARDVVYEMFAYLYCVFFFHSSN